MRESHSKVRVLYPSLLCVNQWGEKKYFILFRYWLKLKGTLPMSNLGLKDGQIAETQSWVSVRFVGYYTVPHTFLYEPMGRREIFHTFWLLVKIEGHFTYEFVTYVYETPDRFGSRILMQSRSVLSLIDVTYIHGSSVLRFQPIAKMWEIFLFSPVYFITKVS
jgi:hypothetical protein